MQLARARAKDREGRSVSARSSARCCWRCGSSALTTRTSCWRCMPANAPFGGNVVGLEAASWRYFGRGPQRSVLGRGRDARGAAQQSLAGARLAQSRAAAAKRDQLLQPAADAGDLTALDLDLALAEPLVAEPHELPDLAPHLLETLRAAVSRRGTGCAPRSMRGCRRTRHAQLERALGDAGAPAGQQRRGDRHRQPDASKCSPTSAMQMGTFLFPRKRGQLKEPRPLPERACAVDIIRRPRSTGSILKPLLYAAMLEDGSLTPRMLLPDVPTHYEGFSPENFDRQYRGAVRADEALAHSLNVPAVRMLKTYGVARFADLLRDAGMTHADASRRRLRPHADPGRRRRQSLGHRRACTRAWPRSRAPAPPTRAPRFREPSALLPVRRVRRRGDTPISTGSAWLTLDALLEVPRPGEEGALAQLRVSRAHRLENRHELRPARRLGRGHAPRATRSACGSAMRVAKAARASPVPTMAAPLMFGLFNGLPRERLVRPARRTRCARSSLRQRRLPALPRIAKPRARWVPKRQPLRLRSRLTTCACISTAGAARVRRRLRIARPHAHASWFVLPPAQEFYYRRVHAEYRPLPRVRARIVRPQRDAAARRSRCSIPSPTRAS